MMAIEAQRVVRAGDHLRELERRVNASFPDGWRPLRWETALVDGSHARVSGYGVAILAVVTTTAVLGPGLGGYLLADDGAWAGFVAAEGADIAVLVAVLIRISLQTSLVPQAARDRSPWRRAWIDRP